jgi:hypothetical protein
LSRSQPQQQQQPQTQQYQSNIPTHKPNSNFQQTLPRYNHPPQLNPARRLVQRGRYSTGSASLIQPPGSIVQQHHPPPSLNSPALSTASSAQTVTESQRPKSHLSRIPGEMLKFQVRKSDGDPGPPPAHPQTSQLQVS